MKKNETFTMRCNPNFRKDVEYISKMEDIKGLSATLEFLVKDKLEYYKKLGIVRK